MNIIEMQIKLGNRKEYSLLVRIPADMKYFRQMTEAICRDGKKTLESFPQGRPLANRVNT